MFCASCGAELAPDTVFCHECGTRVTQVAESSPSLPDEGATARVEPSSVRSHAGVASPSSVVASPYQPAPSPAARTGLTTAGVWSIICSVLALFLVPPLLGGIAVYLGFRAKKQGDAAGDLLIVVGVVALIAGMVIGTILWTQAR